MPWPTRSFRTAAVGGLALAIGLTAWSDALACRLRVPHEVELAFYPKVVVVTVKGAELVKVPELNQWRIVAEGEPTGWNPRDRTNYEFVTRLLGGGCGVTDLPPDGERWVLYLSKESDLVFDAYPLEHVRRQDPRLSRAF